MKRHARLSLMVIILFLITLTSPVTPNWLAPRSVLAQEETPPPFMLPFDTPPSPSTWLMGQFYGNTTSAYRFRNIWYPRGQGLHFGLDFSAPCGTEVVAIGDGIVAKVDASEHGSGPHNLVIRHEAAGYASLYGHLMERPRLNVG